MNHQKSFRSLITIALVLAVFAASAAYAAPPILGARSNASGARFSSGGSGGDPWPTRAGQPLVDFPIYMHGSDDAIQATSLVLGSTTLFAYRTADGDGEIAIAAVTPGKPMTAARVTTNGDDDRSPLLIGNATRGVSVVAERVFVTGHRLLIDVPITLTPSLRAGVESGIALLPEGTVRWTAARLADRRTIAVLAVETGTSVELRAVVAGDAQATTIASLPPGSDPKLAMTSTHRGEPLLEWMEADGTRGAITMDESGRWGRATVRALSRR